MGIGYRVHKRAEHCIFLIIIFLERASLVVCVFYISSFGRFGNSSHSFLSLIHVSFYLCLSLWTGKVKLVGYPVGS